MDDFNADMAVEMAGTATVRVIAEYETEQRLPSPYWMARDKAASTSWDNIAETDFKQYEVPEGSADWQEILQEGRFVATLPTSHATQIESASSRERVGRYG